MIDGKDITFYRKSLTSLMIFNTFEWRTLQVAFLPYPKNAETGRHHCLQNVFACKHACMQTCLFANMPTYKHACLHTYMHIKSRRYSEDIEQETMSRILILII